jgi:cytochrome c oxidase subunit III
MSASAFPEPVWTQQERKPLGWWGMLLLVATEATLFGVLVAAYFYIRFKTPQWPPPGEPLPKILLPCILTGVLLLSSVPMTIASRASGASRLRTMRAGLFFVFLLQIAYAVLQLRQFQVDWRHSRPSDDAYASLYYTLTGLHWAHVLVGVLIVLWVQMQLWRVSYRPERGVAVQVAALYVHFVNVLALVILLAVYLSPHL